MIIPAGNYNENIFQGEKKQANTMGGQQVRDLSLIIGLERAAGGGVFH
jgi:hypothetical protein